MDNENKKKRVNHGKIFEKFVEKSCLYQDVDYTRLRDAGYQGSEHNVKNKRFTIRNICDCILIWRGVTIFAEVKRDGKSRAFKNISQKRHLNAHNEWEKEKGLDKKWKPAAGIIAGVIIEIDGQYFFLSIPVLDDMELNIGKKSFNALDARQYGIAISTIVHPRKKTASLDMANLFKDVHSKFIKKGQ